jgi:hypothetical protein
LDASEFGDLMEEKLKANREGIVRKSTWGTLKVDKTAEVSVLETDESMVENPYNKKETARVDASSVFNKLGIERCKSIMLARESVNLDLDHSPIFKV